MQRSETFNLFVCFVLLMGILVSLAYFAVSHGELLAIEEGRSVQDDLVHVERIHEAKGGLIH